MEAITMTSSITSDIFNLTTYVKAISGIKTAETVLNTMKEKAGAKHISFLEFIKGANNNMDLEAIRDNAKSILIAESKGAWPTDDKGFVGYQKAIKAGCNEAVTLNKFSAWTVTNVSKTGVLFTDDEKTANKQATADKAATTKQAGLDTAIKEATAGMIDASLLIPLTVENCIDFLVANGFVQTVTAKGKITLSNGAIKK